MAIWRGAPTQDLILDTPQPAGVTTPTQLGFEDQRLPGPQPRPFHRLEQHDEQWPFPVITATPTQLGFEEDRPPPHRSLPHQPAQDSAPLMVVAIVQTPTQLGFEDQAPPRPQRVPFHRLEQHDEQYPLPHALTPTQLGFESEQHGPQRPLFHRLEQHDDQWKSLPPPVSTPTQFGFEGQQPPRPFVFPFHRLDQHDEQWPFTTVPPPPTLEKVIRRYRADAAGHVLRRLLLSGVVLPPALPLVNDEGRTPHTSPIHRVEQHDDQWPFTVLPPGLSGLGWQVDNAPPIQRVFHLVPADYLPTVQASASAFLAYGQMGARSP